MRLDPFYLIVDDVRWLERLLPLGVKLVQLRIKDRPESELRDADPRVLAPLRASWSDARRQ